MANGQKAFVESHASKQELKQQLADMTLQIQNFKKTHSKIQPHSDADQTLQMLYQTRAIIKYRMEHVS